MCPNGTPFQDDCEQRCEVEDVFLKCCKSVKVTCADGGSWYRPANKEEIFEILQMCPDNGYRFVGGNTAHGKTSPKLFLKNHGKSAIVISFLLFTF